MDKSIRQVRDHRPAGKGPKFIRLSERRKGVTVGENRRWQGAGPIVGVEMADNTEETEKAILTTIAQNTTELEEIAHHLGRIADALEKLSK